MSHELRGAYAAYTRMYMCLSYDEADDGVHRRMCACTLGAATSNIL